MSLTLYYHPLASYCWKVLIALYENDTPFTPRLIDLGNPNERAELTALWPVGKFPVLRDTARNQTVAESSIIIEYLTQHYPGRVRLIPQAHEQALEVHALDRFLDQYVHEPMQKIVGDKLRPAGQHDTFGVEEARARLATSYAMLDQQLSGRTWAAGASFTLADCAAAPALFYANKVAPLTEHVRVASYLSRIHARPSFARVVQEAEPYMRLFPG